MCLIAHLGHQQHSLDARTQTRVELLAVCMLELPQYSDKLAVGGCGALGLIEELVNGVPGALLARHAGQWQMAQL